MCGKTKLNKALKRERFILPALEDIAPQLSGATVFSTVDALSEFWQITFEAVSVYGGFPSALHKYFRIR